MHIDINDVLSDDSTSYWLKYAIKSSLPRDIVDAIADTRLLLSLLERRYNAITGHVSQPTGNSRYNYDKQQWESDLPLSDD